MTASEGDQKKLKAEYLRELMCRGIALEEQWQLSLWDKGLERVPSELTQLAELHVLDLGGNNLRELPAGFSHYLTNLGILDMKKNSFASFPEQILDLASVTELDLSYNKLKSIPAEISQLKRLQKFFLSQNYIQVLPNGICELSLLEELDISYNYLTYLPAKFGQLKRLRTLDLDHNKIPYIPPQVFELRELVEFDFSHNTAISGPLPCNIAFLTNLQVLWLSSNGLTLLPNCIQELVLLEELILDNNKLHNLPCDFKHLQRVKVLNLGFNCYEIFPHAVLALDRVEELFLSRNRLSHIPEEIGLLQHLRVLWLDHNNVENLPDSVTTLVNMEELSVQGNRLKCLPEGFGNLSNLDCLDVRENPLLQPPLEVCTNGVKAIAAFQEELQRVKVPVTPRFKLAFVGRRRSGKTQLKHSLNGNLDVPSTTALSKFLDISTMTFDSGTRVDTVVYDFGGHAVYHFAQQFFFNENCLYLLVVNLYEYKDSTFWDDVGFWLSVIIARVPYACVCIVGTHVDWCNGDEVEGRSLDIHKKISQMFSDMKTKSHLLSIANSMEEFLQESNVQRSVPSPSSPTRRPRYFQSSQNRVLSAVLPVNLGDDQRGIKHIQDLLPYLYSNVQLFRNSCLIVHTTWVHLEDMIKERQESLFITLEDFHSMAAIAGVPKRQRPEVLQWLEDRGSVLYLGNNNPHLRKYVIPTSVNLVIVKLFNCLFGHALRVQSEQRATPHPNNTPASAVQLVTDDLLQNGVVSPYLLHTVLQEAGLTEPQEVVGRFLCDLGMFFPIPYHPSHSSAAMGDSEDGTPQQQQPDTTGKDLVSYSVPWFRHKLSSHTGLRLTLPYYHTTVQIETMQIKCCVWHFCPPGLFERFTATVHPHIVHRMDVSNSCIVYRGKVPVLVELRMSQDLTCLLLTTKMTQVTTWSAWQAVVPLVRELCALLQEWPGMLQSLHVVCPHCLQQGAAEPHEFPGKLLTLPRPRQPAATVRCPKGDGVDVSVALVYPPEPITTFESV